MKADLVLYNGTVLTMDKTKPQAKAFVVLQGKIVYVGTSDIAQLFIGKKTEVIDASEKTVVPGFNDCHIHPMPLYPFEHPLGYVDIGAHKVSSMEELIEALKQKVKITPEGNWILGGLYEDTKLGRHPTRYDLDRVSTKHPIGIRHSSGHVAVANSYALEAANITSETKDPPGGSFTRDTQGNPTGLCNESAGKIVLAAIPLPEATQQEKIEGLEHCFKRYYKHGITSITDARATIEMFKIYQKLRERGSLLRVTLMVHDPYLDELKKIGIRRNFGDDTLKISSVKVFHGNSLSGRTCWLKHPYEKINPKTNQKDYYGIPPARSQQELNDLIYEIHAHGLQAAVHSNGDREIPMVLEAFEKALQQIPLKDHRHRIEHCSVVDQEILNKIKELEVFLAPHSYIHEHGDKMHEYGPERWDMMHPNKSAIDMGIHIGGNSDDPISPAIPLLRIQSMVTRQTHEGKVIGPKQIVSTQQALYAWTMGSAYGSFDEDIKGSIEIGKYADFVVLSDNPLTTERTKIKDIVVEKTFINGNQVY